MPKTTSTSAGPVTGPIVRVRRRGDAVVLMRRPFRREGGGSYASSSRAGPPASPGWDDVATPASGSVRPAERGRVLGGRQELQRLRAEHRLRGGTTVAAPLNDGGVS